MHKLIVEKYWIIYLKSSPLHQSILSIKMNCMEHQVAFNSLLCLGFIVTVFRYTEPLQYLETKSGAICIQTQFRMSCINITISIAFLSLLKSLINILWVPLCIMNTVQWERFCLENIEKSDKWQQTKDYFFLSSTEFEVSFLKNTLWCIVTYWCYHIMKFKLVYKSYLIILFYLTVHIIKADKTKNNVYTIKGQFQQLKFFNENDIYIFLLNTFADQC